MKSPKVFVPEFEVNHNFKLITTAGYVEANQCTGISFKVPDETPNGDTCAGVMINDVFYLAAGDPMITFKVDYPGVDTTRYQIRFVGSDAKYLQVIKQEILNIEGSC